jgi:hypothetical protein
MSEEDTQRLLTEIRDTQREHLAEYKRVTGKLIANQEIAVNRVRRLAIFLILAVLAALLLWIMQNGVWRCLLRGPTPIAPVTVDDNHASPGVLRSYRYTAEQLAEIRDAEMRFKGVETITGLVNAFGEPDTVQEVGSDYGYGPTFRRYVYENRWKTIRVEVGQYPGGNFVLDCQPKSATNTTRPAER